MRLFRRSKKKQDKTYDLRHVIEHDQYELLEDLLVKFDGNPPRPEKDLGDPLLFAIFYDRPACLQAILNDWSRRKVDVNTRVFGRYPPLHFAVRCLMRTRDLSCMRALLAADCEVNSQNAGGKNILHHAVFALDHRGKNGIVDGDSVEWLSTSLAFLIKSGADLNALDNNRDTPLHLCVRYNKFEIFKFMLQAKNDHFDRFFKELLAIPCVELNPDCLLVLASMLFSKKANLSIKNRDGNTVKDLARKFPLRMPFLDVIEKNQTFWAMHQVAR